MCGLPEVVRSLEARFQSPEVERRCAVVGYSQSTPEGNRPTRDRVLLQLVEEARPQMVK